MKMLSTQNTESQTEVGKARLEALTDGIFAIAMTLLIFGLPIPFPQTRDIPGTLIELLPKLLSLIVSFVIAGVYWVAHNTEMRYIRRADHGLIWLNIFFLLFVSLIPFSASVIGRNPGERDAVILYGVDLLLTALVHASMWWHATRHHRLVDPDLPPAIISFGTRLGLIPIIAYGIAIGVAFFSPWLSILLFALTPVPFILGLFYRGFQQPAAKPAMHGESKTFYTEAPPLE